MKLLRLVWWTVASWVMFGLSVLFWGIGWKDKNGNSWRKFLKGFKNPWAMLWRTARGWKQVKLGQYTELPPEAAIAIGIEEFERLERDGE